MTKATIKSSTRGASNGSQALFVSGAQKVVDTRRHTPTDRQGASFFNSMTPALGGRSRAFFFARLLSCTQASKGSSPAPVRKGGGSAPPLRKAGGSTDDLEGLDADSPGTPLNSGSRVKAWVRIASGAASGVEAEDAICVASVPGEDGGIPPSSPRSTALVASSPRRRSTASLAATARCRPPMVSFSTRSSSKSLTATRRRALLCYGDDMAGRGESILGSDGLLVSTAQKVLARKDGNSTLHVASTLSSMELLYDLAEPGSTPNVNETQFGGLHLSEAGWKALNSASELPPLINQIRSQRSEMMDKHGHGAQRAAPGDITLRYAPTDGSEWGNTLYLIELAAPALTRVRRRRPRARRLLFHQHLTQDADEVLHRDGLAQEGGDAAAARLAADAPARRSRSATTRRASTRSSTCRSAARSAPRRSRPSRGRARRRPRASRRASTRRRRRRRWCAASGRRGGARGAVGRDGERDARADGAAQDRRWRSCEAAVEGKRAMLAEVEEEVASRRPRWTEQLAKNETAAKAREGEQRRSARRSPTSRTRSRACAPGTKLQEAMETLKKTIGEEKVALRKQVSEMEERLATPRAS